MAKGFRKRAGAVFCIPTKKRQVGDPEKKKAQRRAAEEAAKAEQERKAKILAEREAQAAKGPSKKVKKRMAARERLIKEGKIEKTEEDVEELTKLTRHVAFAVADCQDEVELRSNFRSQGTVGRDGKYFTSSRYRFRYALAKDGTPVAQIIDKTPWLDR